MLAIIIKVILMGQGGGFSQADSELSLGLATKLRGTSECCSLHLEGT